MVRDGAEELGDVLRQWFETDRLLGVGFAPVEFRVVEALWTVPQASPAPAEARPAAKTRAGTAPARESLAARERSPGSKLPSSTGSRAASDSAAAATPVPERTYDDPLAAERAGRLKALDEGEVKKCRKCVLCQGRKQTVFGQGSPVARVVFVGEGPGFEEDRQGLAFVGPAGQQLTRMIIAMGLTRDDVYICNTVKCRPPNNRTPEADEILACLPYLREQLEIIHPEVIVALGAPAAKTLLNTAAPISKLRGQWRDYFLSGTTGSGPSIPVMPTFHPAYLLRNESEKGKTWADLQEVMRRLGLPLPSRGG